MKQHRSKWAGNAEVEIDYVNKKVSFKYPIKKINENLAYFTHNFYLTIGFLFGIGMSLIIGRWLSFSTIKNGLINAIYSLLLGLYWLGGIILFAYISLFIHKVSPAARKAFPKTNAILSLLKVKRKINLSQKYSKRHYVDENKLILFDYDITFFRFKYEGKNKLLKVNTKSVEKKNRKGEHYDFIAIFTFKDIIKKGILNYC